MKLNRKGKAALSLLMLGGAMRFGILGGAIGFGLMGHATANPNVYETLGTMISTEGEYAEFKVEIGNEYHIFECENHGYEKHELYVFKMDSMGTATPEDDKIISIKHL